MNSVEVIRMYDVYMKLVSCKRKLDCLSCYLWLLDQFLQLLTFCMSIYLMKKNSIVVVFWYYSCFMWT